MLRVICQETATGDAAHIGGPVQVYHKTFAIDAPEVEAWLRAKVDWGARSVVGIEVVEEQSQPSQ